MVRSVSESRNLQVPTEFAWHRVERIAMRLCGDNDKIARLSKIGRTWESVGNSPRTVLNRNLHEHLTMTQRIDVARLVQPPNRGLDPNRSVRSGAVSREISEAAVPRAPRGKESSREACCAIRSNKPSTVLVHSLGCAKNTLSNPADFATSPLIAISKPTASKRLTI